MKWKLVPEEPTQEMKTAVIFWEDAVEIYKEMLAAAPQPDHDRMTKEEAYAKQNWKGMDGAIAFHLIERHADGWNETGEMMNAWLEANKGESPAIQVALDAGEDTTGLCTVRDAVERMFKRKSDVHEMYYEHEGKKWNVELRVLRVEDKEKA